MNDQDPTARVLASADALIRRHRVFLAGARTAPTAADEPLAELPAEAGFDDIPVLTEVVTSSPAGGDPGDAAGLAQRQRLEEALALWLDEQLPLEVLRITDGWNDQLIAALTRRMQDELLPHLLAGLAEPPGADTLQGASDRDRQS